MGVTQEMEKMSVEDVVDLKRSLEADHADAHEAFDRDERYYALDFKNELRLPDRLISHAAIVPTARLKHLAPRNVNIDTGGGRLFMEGKLWPQPGGKGRGSGPLPPGAGGRMRQGGVDPIERIKDMDIEECDISVNYGAVIGVGVSGLENAELAAALARIYNEWLARYCSHNPKCLKGIAAVPLQNVPMAIAEARHAVQQLGMIGVSVPSNVHGKPISDPDFHPFFEALEGLDVPLGIHVGPASTASAMPARSGSITSSSSIPSRTPSSR